MAGGGIAAGCVLLGTLLATDTLGAIDPRYRFAAGWREARPIGGTPFGTASTQAAAGVYSEILPWERWAPPPPEPRFAFDNPALLGAETDPPPVMRRARAEPDFEAETPWYREPPEPIEVARSPEPVAAAPIVAERPAESTRTTVVVAAPDPPRTEATPTPPPLATAEVAPAEPI